MPYQILIQMDNVLSLKETKTICMKHNLIANCEIYDIGNEIKDSTFLCLKCKVGYYLNNSMCVKRLVSLRTCLLYEDY